MLGIATAEAKVLKLAGLPSAALPPAKGEAEAFRNWAFPRVPWA